MNPSGDESRVQIDGPLTAIEADCERVLRTLPEWFGIEASLLEYARNANRLPTFVARDADRRIIGLLILEQHFPTSWEVNCIAVEANWRGKGIGRLLHAHIEEWLLARGARLLQVKTLAESHPSLAYAETRRFYESIGYLPVEVFPLLWEARLPVLQLAKPLAWRSEFDGTA